MVPHKSGNTLPAAACGHRLNTLQFPDSLKCKCAARSACLCVGVFACVCVCYTAFRPLDMQTGSCCLHLDVTWWLTVKSEIGISLVADRKGLSLINLLKCTTLNITWLKLKKHLLMRSTPMATSQHETYLQWEIRPLDASVCYRRNASPTLSF